MEPTSAASEPSSEGILSSHIQNEKSLSSSQKCRLIVVSHPDGDLSIGSSNKGGFLRLHCASLIERRTTALLRPFYPIGPAANSDGTQLPVPFSSLFTRQQFIFFTSWALDAVYLLAMIVLYSLIGRVQNSTLQNIGTFFLDHRTSKSTLAFLLVALSIDTIGCAAAYYHVINILTLMLVCNIVLIISSAAYSMTSIYIVLRVVVTLTGLELRSACLQLDQLRPPVSLFLNGATSLTSGFKRRLRRTPRMFVLASREGEPLAPSGNPELDRTASSLANVV